MSKKASLSSSESPASVASSNGGSAPDCDSSKRQCRSWPEDVGIIAMEVYFPSQCVDQNDLEVFDGVSKGKYTIGLGQNCMGFCSDREDINSLCLTVFTRLVEKTGIGYQSIGRLEVGTETIIDKSKSVKSALMSVLGAEGNYDVEGVDTTNACYGGTAALLNAVNWVESRGWDGRYAVVVAGDIAVYANGPARPTGGAGAVALLVGPHASLVMDTGIRSSHMDHSYDFYKPDLTSEYPKVDGKLSIQCYFLALDACYQRYLKKAHHKIDGLRDLNGFNAVLFHTPYCKLVQKSFARLAFNDFLQAPQEKLALQYPGLEAFRSKSLSETYFDRDVEKAFMTSSSSSFQQKTKASLLLASEVGNMYTASLYGGLASLLASYSGHPLQLLGQRLGFFSYGSGQAATFFSVTVKLGRPPSAITTSCTSNINSNGSAANSIDSCAGAESDGLVALVESLSDLSDRLKSRLHVSPQQFSDTMANRERTHLMAPYTPTGDVDALFPGTFYLTHIDEMYRRQYSRSPSSGSAGGRSTAVTTAGSKLAAANAADSGVAAAAVVNGDAADAVNSGVAALPVMGNSVLKV